MPKYDAQINLAERLIRSKGGAVTVSRSRQSDIDPVTQQATVTTSSASGFAVEIPAGRSVEFRLPELIQKQIRRFYLAMKDLALTPEPGDDMAWADGKTYTIRHALILNPAGDGAILADILAEVA